MVTTPSTASTSDDSTLTTFPDEHARELRHSASAPVQFFEAWKRGVELAGPLLFGNEPRADIDRASSIKDLAPKMDFINDAIGQMSTNERVFLAALVSFFDIVEGGRLLQRVGVTGFGDLRVLDLKHRAVIAALILNNTGG